MLKKLEGSLTNEKVVSVLVGILLVFSLGNYLLNGVYAALKYKGQDFVSYYASGKMLVQGINIHDPDDREEGLANLKLTRHGEPLLRATRPWYPPFWYLMVSSLTILDWESAFVLWTALNQIFLAILIWLLLRYFDIRFFSLETVLLVFMMLNFYPLHYTLMEGQVNILILCAIVFALWLFKNKMDWGAGLVLGLATGIKIMPVFLLIYFLWKGHWKVVLFGVLGFLGTLLITWAGAGGETLMNYYTVQLFKHGGGLNPDFFNQSINGFWSRLFTSGVSSNGWIDSPSTAKVIITVSSLTLLGLSLIFTRGRDERCSFRWNVGLGIFILTMMLASSWTMEHHFINLFVIWLILFTGYFRGQEIGKWSLILAILCFGLAAINLPYGSGKLNSGILILAKSLKFYLLVIMWVVFGREILRLRGRAFDGVGEVGGV